MKKILRLFLVFLIVSCTREQDENNIYSIDGYCEAYFPNQPILHKRFENNAGIYGIYNYQDDFNNIQYVALYIILKKKPKDNKGYLYQYIHSVAESWDGKVLKYEQVMHDGNDEMLYVSETIKGDELVYEFGVVAIKDGIIFQWAVEAREGISEADKIFGEKVKKFKVLK